MALTIRRCQTYRPPDLFTPSLLRLVLEIPIVKIPFAARPVHLSALALATLLGGNYINLFDLYGRSYQVIPQVPRRDRINPEDLTKYYVRAGNGEMVPLSTLTKLSMYSQPDKLVQFNQLNSATFSAMGRPAIQSGRVSEQCRMISVTG